MSKATLHQDILGRKLVERHPATFDSYGLKGKSVTIIAAWIKKGDVKVQVEDFEGHTSGLWLSNFRLVPKDGI